MGVDAESSCAAAARTPTTTASRSASRQFALRTSRAANGVSRRHGEVAREMWHDLWPDRAVEDVPIAHVTNGVHIPTWIGGPMRELLDRHLGEGWLERAADPATWAPVDDIPTRSCGPSAASSARADRVRARAQRRDRLGRGEPPSTCAPPRTRSTRRADDRLRAPRRHLQAARPAAARRRPRAGAARDDDRPVQLVLAGKAHPRDDDGKRLVQRLFEMKGHAEVGRRVVYLDDYDLALGARWCAAATSGSTSRGRRWRRAARAG